MAVTSFVVQAPALEFKRASFNLITHQGRHPLRPLLVANESLHEAKLAFRLVPPLLVRILSLNIETYMYVQVLLGIASLAGLAWLFHRCGYSRQWVFALIGGLALTYMGAVWFLDTTPYFDALAASAFVLALCVPHPASVFLASSLALWTDERSILAVGVVALFYMRWNRRESSMAVGAACVAYVLLRLFLGQRYGLSTGKSEIGPGVFFDYWTGMPLAILLALEGLWVVVLAAYATAMRRREWLIAAAGVLTAGSLAGSVMVNDVTRSTVYALPGVVFAITYLVDKPRKPLVVGVALCAFPTSAAIVTTGAVFEHISFYYPLPLRLLF